MIKSIRLQNFFGFQDCTINLEKGENVLVGINGSGKSNFFKAINFLKGAVEGTAIKNLIYGEWGSADNTFFLGDKEKFSEKRIRFGFLFSADIINRTLLGPKTSYIKYLIEIGLAKPNAPLIFEKIIFATPEGREVVIFNNKNGIVEQLEGFKFNDPQLTLKKIKVTNKNELAFSVANQIPNILIWFRAYLLDINVYSFFDTSKNSDIRKPVVLFDQIRLLGDGSNLTQVLSWLKQNDKKVFSKINEELEKVSASFSRVDFLPLGTHIQLQLDEKHLNRPTPILNVSDGTLKFLCLLAILYNPRRGDVICIDEPELGLHPDMINTLYEAIKYAAKTSQIIISTHSPELLNHFNLENIRVFEKDEKNATIVNQYETEQFDDFMNKYMPGQLWRDGHLGGNRW